MSAQRFTFSIFILLAQTTFAQDGESVAPKVKKLQDAYHLQLDAAKSEFLAAFDAAVSDLKSKKDMRVELQVAKLKQLKLERDMFVAELRVPTVNLMAKHSREYKRKASIAKFDFMSSVKELAEVYRDAGNLEAAEDALVYGGHFLNSLSTQEQPRKSKPAVQKIQPGLWQGNWANLHEPIQLTVSDDGESINWNGTTESQLSFVDGRCWANEIPGNYIELVQHHNFLLVFSYSKTSPPANRNPGKLGIMYR